MENKDSKMVGYWNPLTDDTGAGAARYGLISAALSIPPGTSRSGQIEHGNLKPTSSSGLRGSIWTPPI